NNHVQDFKSYHLPPIENNIQDSDSLEVKLQKTDEFVKKLDERQKQLPPLNFQLNYMAIPQRGIVDRDALMGASFEELGGKLSVPVKQMDAVLNMKNSGEAITVDALDLNRDGNIDVAEYSASILLADMLDDDIILPNGQNIDGNITNKGEQRLLDFGLAQNKEVAYRTYMALYQGYNLKEAGREFASKQNNMLKI
ncbi:hypothetical protein IJ670_05985, partial [bacterium]|nr:hypothetical protein [bacterium]